MKTYYVRMAQSIYDFFPWIKGNTLKKMLSAFLPWMPVKKMELENKVILTIPLLKTKKITNKQYSRMAKKIVKKESLRDIVLTKDLFYQEAFIWQLKKDSVHIFDGKWLEQYLIPDCLFFICKKQKQNLEEKEISILVNELSDIVKQIIINLAQKVRLLNIITNQINSYQKIEDFLYQNYGIMVRVTNNKKALSKSDIIINMDYSEEKLNYFSLPKKGIILNLGRNIRIKSKKFEGINIRNYKMIFQNQEMQEFKQLHLEEEFERKILYESILYRKDSYKNIREKIQKDKVQITELIGLNGIIHEREYVTENS